MSKFYHVSTKMTESLNKLREIIDAFQCLEPLINLAIGTLCSYYVLFHSCVHEIFTNQYVIKI